MTPRDLRQLLGVFILGTLTCWPASAVRADYGDVLTIQLVLDSATLAARGIAVGDTLQVRTCIRPDSTAVPCTGPCPGVPPCDCECTTVVVDNKNRALLSKPITNIPPVSDTVFPPPVEHTWISFEVNGELLTPPIRAGHSMSSDVARNLNNGGTWTYNSAVGAGFGVAMADNPSSPVARMAAGSGQAAVDMWRPGGLLESNAQAVVDSLPSVTLSASTSQSALYLRNIVANRVMQVNDLGLVFPDGSVQGSASSWDYGYSFFTGRFVKLQDSTNSVVIGASTTTGHKLNVEGDIEGIRSKGTSTGAAQTFNGLEIYHEHAGPGPGTGWGSDIEFRSKISGVSRLMATVTAKRDGSNTRSRLEWAALDGSTYRYLVLTADGFVGIGTTTPSQTLDVAGNIRTTGDLIIPSGFGRIRNYDNRAILETDWTSTFGDYTAINSGYDWELAHEPLSMVAGNHAIFFMKGSAGTPYTTQLAKIDSVGRMVLGAAAPTAKLDVIGTTGYNQLRMRTSYTPASTADANGNVGDIAWDNNFVYVKTSAGWKRSALSVF